MTPRQLGMIVLTIATSYGKNRINQSGPLFYAMVWLSFPIFALMSVAVIYRNEPELRNYAIVAGSAVAFIFLMLYGAGQALDVERQRGTLGSLFLAPAPRFAWLGGFQLCTLVEVLFSATTSLLIGVLVFGVDLAIDPLSLLVTLLLFFAALWGLSMIIGSVGVAMRDANQLTNLLFPVFMMLAGAMFPIDRMPDWLRIPARCLPFSYGMDGLTQSLTADASLADLQSTLLPLAGFALVLPVIGVLVFGQLERSSRRHGTLEFMN